MSEKQNVAVSIDQRLIEYETELRLIAQQRLDIYEQKKREGVPAWKMEVLERRYRELDEVVSLIMRDPYYKVVPQELRTEIHSKIVHEFKGQMEAGKE